MQHQNPVRLADNRDVPGVFQFDIYPNAASCKGRCGDPLTCKSLGEADPRCSVVARFSDPNAGACDIDCLPVTSSRLRKNEIHTPTTVVLIQVLPNEEDQCG